MFVAMALQAQAGELNLLANGGFETVGRRAPRYLEGLLKNGVVFENDDPLLPVGWTLHGSNARGELSPEARSGQRAWRVAAPDGYLALDLSQVEVVPGATYTFGASVAGTAGRGHVRVYGIAFEGRLELARVPLAPAGDWTSVRDTVNIPGHIRFVAIEVVAGGGELLIDDVFFAAEFAEPFDAGAMLSAKFQADSDTLALVDFDGQGDFRPEAGAERTDEKGGRFGRGLRLDRGKASSAVIPLTLEDMPEEGTLEFWLSPDEEPEHIHWYMALLSGDQDVMRMQADTSQSLGLSWRVSPGAHDPPHTIRARAEISRGAFRPGQWTHVAAQWDAESVRYFVNGTLVGHSTETPQPFFGVPSAIKLGSLHSVYAWSGVIDEVRLSKVQRYGPRVPAGATWRPFVTTPPPAAEEPAAAPAEKVLAEDELARQRQAILAPLPPPPADGFTMSAAAVRPLIDDDPEFALRMDEPIPGMATARIGAAQALIRDPDNDGGIWTLQDIPPARYFIGVWFESSRDGLEAPQTAGGRLWIYLNGRIAQLATHSDPVQVAPGVFFAEAQSKDAEFLQPGDVIAVLPHRHRPIRIARLDLHPLEPVRGSGRLFENYGANWFSRGNNLRMNLDCAFLPASGGRLADVHFRQVQGAATPAELRRTADGARAVAQCRIANPLPIPLTVEFDATIKAYFRETVGTDRATLTLAPHARVTREIPFDIIPDSRRYTIEANARAVAPPALDMPRSEGGLGWPGADTISFFPGLRQSIPWRDPFTARDERALQLSGELPGDRQVVSLNGSWNTWSYATTMDLQPPMPAPAGLEWKVQGVPFAAYQCEALRQEPRPHGVYLRREFTLPDDGRPRTHRLVLARLDAEGTVYVNGRPVGNMRGGNTPLVCDATDALRPGVNELVVVLRDMLAVMNPDYVNPQSPVLAKDYLDAPGGMGFELGAVSLESMPRVAAQDLQVITSYRKKSISGRLRLLSHETARRKVRLTLRVLDAGRPVMDLGERELDVEPGRPVSVEFAKPWPDPILWGPGQPHLYTLAAETTDAASGGRLDMLAERFGFRESWIEGGRILFNGAPVRLKGSTVQGGGGVIGGDDVVLSRGTPIPDFMDEFGYLATRMLGGLHNNPSRHNVERDAFWEANTANTLAGAARAVNHACIIAWDLSNEWLSFLDYGGGDPLAGAKRFKAVSDALNAYDPTRWTFFNGDEDLHGLHDTHSVHYLLEGRHPHPVAGFGFNGRSCYFPDAAFFRPLDHAWEPGEPVQLSSRRSLIWNRDEKPLMNTENLWKVSFYQPPGPCKFVGEEEVLSPAVDSGRGAMAWMWKMNVDGHRDLGTSAIFNYTPICGVAWNGHMQQCFIMPDHTHHAFGGRSIRRDYTLHNDLLTPADYSFRWSLLDPGGRTVAGGEDRRRMDSGDLQRGRFELQLPDVTERTTYVLKLDLLADGRFAYGEERDIDVWPDVVIPVGASARKLFLFDPSGETAAAFTRSGIAFEALSVLSAPPGEAATAALVIGENALTPTLPHSQTPTLSSFVSDGGRLVILAQEHLWPDLPVRTLLEPREWSSMPFIRTPQHPIFTGAPSPGVHSGVESRESKSPITSWDLHFWAPDHVSARGAYSKPDGGPFVTLVDSGMNLGLEWVQMMEARRGRGFYLLCQLDVAGKSDTDPLARELLARIAAYAAGASEFEAPARVLPVVAGANSAVFMRLRALGVACRAVPAESVATEPLWMVDAATLPADFEAPAAWKTALAAGATVVVHGAVPEQQRMLSGLAGRPVRLTVHPYRMWEGRGYRNGFTWLTPGLSQIDLYWKDYDGLEGATAQAEDPKYKYEDLNRWSAAAEGGVEHIFPGALVEVPAGRGRLVLDQVRWETPHPGVDRMAARVVTAMMTGLGVTIEPYLPPRPLPDGIVWQPIDLTPFANRGFADELGDDGQGGWSDQGPRADLRDFPTGRRAFGGVTFQIGEAPHSCIVLRSALRPFPERMPVEATIPVNARVEGLTFLHSATYSGGREVGRYQVQYADGSVHNIDLVNGDNIRDWIMPPGAYPRERGTQSRVAWTGTTDLFPVVAVYQMLWVNPRPEQAVRAVRFCNPLGEACPILIALSMAVPGGADAALEIAAGQARARDLFKAGQAAFAAGRDAEAREILQQAVAADSSFDAAHQTLGEVCERLKDEDGALAAYRAWAQAGAATPLPFNKIGEALERKQDFRGALEAYTRSLEIEWNQPPAIEAKSRLQKQVGR